MHPSDSQYNPLAKYNEKLGIATNSLQDFSAALKSAEEALPKPGSRTEALGPVTPAQASIATTAGRQLTNPAISNFKGDKAAAVAFLRQMDSAANGGQMNAEQLQAVKLDMIQAYGVQFTNDVFSAYSKPGGGNDIKTLVNRANQLQAPGYKFYQSSTETQDVLGATAGGIVTQAAAAQAYGGAYANQVTGRNVEKYLTALIGRNIDSRTQEQGIQALIDKNLLPQGFTLDDLAKYNPNGPGSYNNEQAVINYLKNSPNSPYKGINLSAPLNGVKAPDYMRLILGQTAAGRVASSSTAVQAAINAGPGDINKQYQAAQDLIDKQTQMGESITDIISGFDDMKGSIKDVTNQYYILADVAQQLARQQLAYNQPYQSRSVNIAQARALYANAVNANPDNPDYQKNLQAAKDQMMQQQQQVYDYYKNIIQAYRDYTVQDTYARQDYQKQVYRSTRDFHIQLADSEYQFNLSQLRARRDFNHQIVLMTKEVASQQYNAYTRVQTAQTFDADSLLTNVNRQNQMIRDQVANLARLRKMGVSQSTIDVLGLSDPSNAQQLARTVSELAADPALVKAFNASIKNRLDWTKGLVTDKSSTQYIEMKYQFNKAADDARKDFEHSMSVATAAFNRSLSDMAVDFQTSEKRAMEQLQRMSQEIYGSFEQVETTALALLGTHSAAAADVVINNYMRARNTIVSGGTGGGGSGGSHGAPGARGTSGSGGGYSWSGGGSTSRAPVFAGVPSATRSQIGAVAANAEQKKINERNELLAAAYAELGVPYRWGGDDPKTGFDCSGLVYWAEHHAGLGLGRTNARTYQRMARKTTSPIPGDLVFYGSPAYHVGIYVGNGAMIDAPHPGAQVRVEGVGKPTNYGVLPGLATGGIAFTPHLMGEGGPEAAIPLDSRGAHFMAKFMMVTMDQLRTSVAGSIPTPVYGAWSRSTNVNASTHFNGDIHVEANDPNQFVYKLAQRKRLSALTRPVQGGRG